MHETIEALSAYVDDEVSAAERARIEAHLAACVDCASRKTLLERASASVRALPVPEPTIDEARRIREGVLAQTRSRYRVQRGLRSGLRPLWAGAGALALVIVAVIAGSALFRGGRNPAGTTAGSKSSEAGASALAFDNAHEVRSFVAGDADVKQALDAAEALDAAGAGGAPGQSRGETATSAPQAPAPAKQRFGAKAPAEEAPDAASAPEPPTTLQAPPDSGRNELRAAAPERSFAECLAERQEGRTDIRLAATRAATYAGEPAWLLVYAVPSPAPGGAEQVAFYVVARADCEVLTHQVLGAP